MVYLQLAMVVLMRNLVDFLKKLMNLIDQMYCMLREKGSVFGVLQSKNVFVLKMTTNLELGLVPLDSRGNYSAAVIRNKLILIYYLV